MPSEEPDDDYVQYAGYIPQLSTPEATPVPESSKSIPNSESSDSDSTEPQYYEPHEESIIEV